MAYRELKTIANLAYGVNFRGFTGSVTMREGEAQDALDMLPSEDGQTYKTFGWRRINDSALAGTPVANIGFTYRGKNNVVTTDPTRPGNFGLVDDSADFTRRTEEFTSYLQFTTTTAYFWNPSTETFDTIALPGGVSVDVSPKPSMQVFKENVYIVGWADQNLRYDPTDRAFYRWGWESAPAAPVAALAAGGTLSAGAVYKYAYTYFDVYTAEETTLGAVSSVTATSTNATVNLTLTAYTGARHFNGLSVSTDSDVGIAVYRTNEDDDAYYLLTTLTPGTTAFSDTGLALDTSLPPWRGTMQDEPRFSALQEFKGRFYALSRATNSNRMYHSDFTTAPFVERWPVLGYKDLPVTEGDSLTAIGRTDATLIAYTRKGAFRNAVVEGTGAPQIIPTRLPWDAGCVGPRARRTIRGWEYFVSDRGPFRWREGITDPQWIGENISPMFIHPVSGLCKLNERARELTEVGFDWISNTARFIFATGSSTLPNTHMAYWIEAQEVNGDYRLGWWPQSPHAQCMDLTSSIDRLDETGRPVTGHDRQERLVFGDADGYIYEYELAHKRGGLKEGALARGFVTAGSTVSSLSTDGGLFTTGDGLTSLRLEVRAADGSVQIRKIESNTDNAIVPTEDFDTAPATGDVFFVGGIPAYWRSWVDHVGDPHMHKSLVELYVGLNRTGSVDTGSSSLYEWILDVNVGAGDFPTAFERTRTAELSEYRKKLLISLTGRFFVYEFSNSRPDELFVLTNLQRDFLPIPAKRFA